MSLGYRDVEPAAKAMWARDVRADTPAQLGFWDRLDAQVKDWYMRAAADEIARTPTTEDRTQGEPT